MKKTFILLAEGFEEIEALTIVDVLRRADIICDMCSIDKIQVKGAHNIKIESDLILENLNYHDYDAVILPGGMPGSTNLRDNEEVIEIIKYYNKKNKIIAAICAAPIVLHKAGIINNRRMTSYPGIQGQLENCIYSEETVVVDNNITTSRGPATALTFALELVNLLKDKETKENLKKQMLVKI